MAVPKPIIWQKVRSHSGFLNSKEVLECLLKKTKPYAQVLWKTSESIPMLSEKPFIKKKKKVKRRLVS